MEEKKADLLNYTRTLYDRQNSKASKAGMTYWAILAGVIYVIWHLLETVADIPNSPAGHTDFYLAFSQIHLSILSAFLLIGNNGLSRDKKKLDYRILRDDGGALEVFVFSLAFFLPTAYAIIKVLGESVERLPFTMQIYINF